MDAFPSDLRISDQDVLQRFFSLGYFQGAEWDEVRTFVLSDLKVKQAVEQFRDFHGLQPDDKVDEQLVTQLFVPRCGLPDFVRMDARGLCKWPMLDVTCAQRISGLQPLDAETEKRLYQRALQNWNDVCGIRLKLVDAYDSANIYSGVGNTSSGVLAYSYLPCGASQSTRLQQVYNRATNWSQNLLLQVITHEIGHAIGLDHGPSGALMQPSANGAITKPQAWDIQQVQSRYGKPGPKPPMPPTGPAIIISSDLKAGRYRLVPDTSQDWDMSP
jgi:hypothetical protein